MSEYVECDNCGTRGMARWLHVEWEGLDLFALDEDSGPWDFCDPVCLAEWSIERPARSAMPRVHPG